LALNTTARGCELKAFRWRDVNLIGAILTIRRSKTDAGERVIPLNAAAKEALVALYRRSESRCRSSTKILPLVMFFSEDRYMCRNSL
jgi:integrase